MRALPRIVLFCFFWMALCLPAAAQPCDTTLAPERWSEPQLLEIPGYTEGYADFPSWSYDGKTLYWYSHDYFWQSTLADTGFTHAMHISANINRPLRSMCVSPDNRTLYFTGWNDYSGWDIYYAEWDSIANRWGKEKQLNEVNYWGPDTPPDSEVTTYMAEFTVQISPDGSQLYYSALIDDFYACSAGFDIFCTTWDSVQNKWGPRKRLNCKEINYPLYCGPGTVNYNDNMHPTFTHDGKKMYLGKNVGGIYSDEVYVSYLDSAGNWPKAKRLNLNSYADIRDSTGLLDVNGLDYCPAISPDGRTLVFASRRGKGTTSEELYISHLIIDENGDSVLAVPSFSQPEGSNLTIQAYPNPFKGNTILKIDASESDSIYATIYNLFGAEVKIFTVKRGSTLIEWNATDDNGRQLIPGVYLLVVSSGRAIHTHTLIHY